MIKERERIKKYMDSCNDIGSDFAHFVMVLLDQLETMDERLEKVIKKLACIKEQL